MTRNIAVGRQAATEVVCQDRLAYLKAVDEMFMQASLPGGGATRAVQRAQATYGKAVPETVRRPKRVALV